MEMVNSVSTNERFQRNAIGGNDEKSLLETSPCETQYEKRVLIFDCDEASRDLVFDALSCAKTDIKMSLTICHCCDELEAQLGDGSDERRVLSTAVVWGLKAPYDEDLNSLVDLKLRYPEFHLILLAPQEALVYASEIRNSRPDAFILKPFHGKDVRCGVDKVFAPSLKTVERLSWRSSQTADSLAITLPIESYDDLGMVGGSPEIRKVIALIRKVGPSRVNIFITGESGTGKEMVARAIHNVSPRAQRQFVAINCAAIPRELLESELFGHAKGAFTGATSARRGLFEEAHEGTILLDEIGDLPLSLQAKILRLLQTREVKPLGQNSNREVDVRIISATHKNLKELIRKGEFREDLYYRLNVMPIHLPALRERGDDVVLLAKYFLRRYGEKYNCSVPLLSTGAATKLRHLPWRGNVRELENVIERALVLSDGERITEGEILVDDGRPAPLTSEDLFNAGMTLKDIEREYIKYILMKTGNRKEAATKILGIDRKTLYRKERSYQLLSPSEFN